MQGITFDLAHSANLVFGGGVWGLMWASVGLSPQAQVGGMTTPEVYNEVAMRASALSGRSPLTAGVRLTKWGEPALISKMCVGNRTTAAKWYKKIKILIHYVSKV
ncbi:MAG: hypothetical protein GOMPHAMPRED_002249 [Gomphillus americanus]|uniref:Uncharacterized protein n=1 Tax=Gomphillus americanus TaxID=1940652 RepID=A0A8H3IHM4_9LECA|nr:MAG: hypothetical protein GOMPHAMPRED_002249 [Gomphillus americanus]